MGKSGGGGSSGAVNYPNYMKEFHHNLLTGSTNLYGVDEIERNVIELMNFCMRTTPITVTSSPYNGVTVIDPDDVFFGNNDTLSTYEGQSAFELLSLFLAETPESLYTSYATDASATAMIAAFTTDLDTQYDDTIIPSLAVGFTDINATMSSAYTIAKAGVAAQKTREVAKFTGEIKTRHALSRTQMKMEWRRLLSTLSIENGRIYLAAKHEENEDAINYESQDNLWDLNLFQYGNSVLASIAGAGQSQGSSYKPSALGAALSGAAAGGMIGAQIGAGAGGVGAGPGAAIGAGAGAVLGYASTM